MKSKRNAQQNKNQNKQINKQNKQIKNKTKTVQKKPVLQIINSQFHSFQLPKCIHCLLLLFMVNSKIAKTARERAQSTCAHDYPFY